jgi:hypothetical protein
MQIGIYVFPFGFVVRDSPSDGSPSISLYVFFMNSDETIQLSHMCLFQGHRCIPTHKRANLVYKSRGGSLLSSIPWYIESKAIIATKCPTALAASGGKCFDLDVIVVGAGIMASCSVHLAVYRAPHVLLLQRFVKV